METVEIELSRDAAEQLHFLLSEEMTDLAADLRPLAAKKNIPLMEYAPHLLLLAKTYRIIGAALA